MADAKRSWFRIHLSTAIVVMLLAAVLLGMNVVGRMSTMPAEQHDYVTVVKRGWPQTFYYSLYHRTGLYSGENWFYSSLVKDVALALGILIAEACTWEWLVRLREARRKNPA